MVRRLTTAVRASCNANIFRALLCPGWTAEWHVGIRATSSQKLVAFISAIPVALRVRKNILKASEVNFMVVHKKLRSKRLAPVLIKEITRRCNLLGVFQAIYTGGVVLPKPVSTCRYFHRAIDWVKLHDVGFSPLPPNSKPQYQVRKYALPDHTATKGLREMEVKDIDAVLSLLKRFLERSEMAPMFTREEVDHWLLHKKDAPGEQVIWSYVVEVCFSPNSPYILLTASGSCHEEDYRLLLLLRPRIIRHQQRQAQERPRSLPVLLRHRTRPCTQSLENRHFNSPQRINQRRPDPRQEIQVRRLQRPHANGQQLVLRTAEVRPW